MIYLYGVTHAGIAAPLDRGLDGAALCAVSAASLGAVCSSHDKLAIRADPESCWTHERVVEALMQEGPVLPARFGTTFSDTGELKTLLERDESALSAQLDAVEGCVELAVRATPPPGRGEPVAQDGGDYLKARVLTRRRTQAVVEEALGGLAGTAVAVRPSAAAIESEALGMSYLVRREDIQRFCRAVEETQVRNPDLALSCTGPWAPYSFTGGTA